MIRRRSYNIDILEKLNGSLDYIEENLMYSIDFKEVERLVSCSAGSFTRAFQDYHGVTPTEARNYGHRLKFYSRMTFHLSEYDEDVYLDQRD